MSTDHTQEVTLTDAQRQYVIERAEKLGMPWPLVLSGLVPAKTEAAEQGRSAFDLAQTTGIIGMSDVGPSDLATNPVHMEGFGRDDIETSPR